MKGHIWKKLKYLFWTIQLFWIMIKILKIELIWNKVSNNFTHFTLYVFYYSCNKLVCTFLVKHR